jgi:methionyl aminopeptidase
MTQKEIENMRVVCNLAKQLLDYISPFVIEGTTTNHLNDLCEEYTVNVLSAESAPLNYHGYPKSICTSINNVVCHGIPNDNKLKNGDIINIDVTIKKLVNGAYFYGDASKMFMIGNVHPRHKFLCQITKECLDNAIKEVKDGALFSKIGEVIEKTATSAGFSVVRDFCGHGIGTEFHTEPQILHYKNDRVEIMNEGMIFTIEPMVNERGYKTKVMEDGWTAITRDGGFSAQYEHTILVTKNGCEVLTQ